MKAAKTQNTKLTTGFQNPFLDFETDVYSRWREQKLKNYPKQLSDVLVDIEDPARLTDRERQNLIRSCRQCNFVIYRSGTDRLSEKPQMKQFAGFLGLHKLDPNLLADEDGVTSLTVAEGKSGRGYIPYSNQRMLWHTDGYYNGPDHQIRAMILHCVRPAVEGGENALLDMEMAYLMLRDKSPELVQALMHDWAMTIPANEEAKGIDRPEQPGPVFSVDRDTGCLHMRYTARTRSIRWRDDALTREAVGQLQEILNGDNKYILRYRLNAGEGILCNNILHNRTAFPDSDTVGEQRLVYRARYYERIEGTALNEPVLEL